ncbi:MAG: hypothetical protein Q9207_001660 [Kuettlingeria erythrocarpa]
MPKIEKRKEKHRQTIADSQFFAEACSVATRPQPKTTNAAQILGGTTFHMSAWNSKTIYAM